MKIEEFQCIMPLANMPSVMEHGILCYDLANKLSHDSVAMDQVQERRDKKEVPGGLRLHKYANLYFNARNPMMSVRRAKADEICVLRIDTEVGHLPDVVFSDANAAANYTRFYSYAQVPELPFDQIYSEDWRDEDPVVQRRQGSRTCAEILVPERVDPNFLIGAYVVDLSAKTRLLELDFEPEIGIDRNLFFY